MKLRTCNMKTNIELRRYIIYFSSILNLLINKNQGLNIRVTNLHQIDINIKINFEL